MVRFELGSVVFEQRALIVERCYHGGRTCYHSLDVDICIVARSILFRNTLCVVKPLRVKSSGPRTISASEIGPYPQFDSGNGALSQHCHNCYHGSGPPMSATTDLALVLRLSC